MLARSLLAIALGGFLFALLALRGAQAQSPTAPTASIDPEAIDAIWQKASSKYDGAASGAARKTLKTRITTAAIARTGNR